MVPTSGSHLATTCTPQRWVSALRSASQPPCASMASTWLPRPTLRSSAFRDCTVDLQAEKGPGHAGSPSPGSLRAAGDGEVAPDGSEQVLPALLAEDLHLLQCQLRDKGHLEEEGQEELGENGLRLLHAGRQQEDLVEGPCCLQKAPRGVGREGQRRMETPRQAPGVRPGAPACREGWEGTGKGPLMGK